MALQIGPSNNLLTPGTLGAPTDGRGALRDLQANQTGTPAQIMGGAAAMPSFGKEFMVLLQAKEAAKDAADALTKGAMTLDSKADPKALAQNLEEEKLIKHATPEEVAAGELLAAQMIAQAVQAAPHQLHGQAASKTSGETPSTDPKTGQVKAEGEPLEWRLVVPTTVAQNQMQASSVPGAAQAAQPGAARQLSLSTPVAGQTAPQEALMAQSLLEVPAGQDIEIESDVTPWRESPVKPSVSTLDHVSGKDFLQTLNALRNQAPAAVAGAPMASHMSRMGMGSEEAGQPAAGGFKVDLLKNIGNDRSRSESDKFRDWSPLSAHPMLTAGTHGQSHMGPPMIVAANVTQGANAQARISSESLAGISQAMQQMTVKGQEQGQMRIRLKPDSLGEIHLKVATHGNQVELQVQASDENAKKIIQGSLADLKDHLASKNLTLGSVDLGILQQPGSAFTGGSDSMMDTNRGQQNQQNAWAQTQSDGSSGQSRQDRSELLGTPDDRMVRPLPRSFVQSDQSTRTAAGRLDVMA